jgi:hypothetical protein
MVTFFQTIYDNKPYYGTIEKALQRIKDCVSKTKVNIVRATLDKDLANKRKAELPCVLFSGKFKDRTDAGLIEHSGFLVLDFDGVYDVQEKKESLKKYSFIYAAWVSPSGNGVKALVKIKYPEKHRQHFEGLKDIFNDLDNSGINVSRVCYESIDPDLWINDNCKSFDKFKIEITKNVSVSNTTNDDFNKILKWLTNRGDAFVTGERNLFMYKLASACCRFGIPELDCESYASSSFLMQDSSFTMQEAKRAIKSAYKSNMFASAEFDKESIVNKSDRQEIVIDADIYNKEKKPKDVIFGLDVKKEALGIYRNGYESADSTGAIKFDEYFKFKKGEITLLSGIGNYGKSNFMKYLMVLSVKKFKRKFAIFTPEEMPAHEFYHDLTEIYLGANCTPTYHNRPTESQYLDAYDIISDHVFCIFPQTVMPTPDYVKERFLELIIKENIFCCIIDPFNQMANDYGKSGGNTAKYLETFLSDCTRFAITNSVNFFVIAHPNKLQKMQDGNYPCPDVFDIADGAMWNNKMDNILIYHRPNHQNDPEGSICEIHTKKIRRQKLVGKKGIIQFEFDRKKRRYIFDSIDYFDEANVMLELNELQPNKEFYKPDQFIEPSRFEQEAPF